MSEQEQVQEQAPDALPEAEPDAQPVEEAAEEEGAEAEEVEGQEAEPAEGEPPEAQALSQKDMESRWKRIAKSAEVWRKRLPEVFEGDAEMFAVCPLCEPLAPGFVMLTPDTKERFPAVREFMGDAAPQEWQQDPNTRTCQTCNGLGMVATGSKVDGQAQLVCTDCGGKGWQGSRPAVAASGPMAAPPLPDANGQNEPTPQGPEPPEAAKLRALGYTLIQPVGT